MRQGTVNPTCYDVIWDETTMPVNVLQRLTYRLCHLYYNWPVSVHHSYSFRRFEHGHLIRKKVKVKFTYIAPQAAYAA